MKKIKEYCAKKGVTPSLKAYFIDAMGSMALGLFASLLIGTIFGAIGMIPALGKFGDVFTQIGGFCKAVSGSAMAAAIAVSLKAPPLVIFSSAAIGYAANSLGKAGGPFAVLLIAIIAVEIGKLISKTTKVDIVVTPFVTIFVGGGLSVLVAPWIGVAVGYIADFIDWATVQTPILMGILVSVVIGIALTLPISSAAICAGLNLSGVVIVNGIATVSPDEEGLGLAMAGAAAVAGCCAQMVGFAVMSFRENGWGGIVSQGIGTSMLQMPNIVKKPIIWLPTIITSAITGPLAVCVFDMKMYGEAINSGMGTCGLLGPIGLALGWTTVEGASAGALQWVGLALICFILPAGVTLLISELFRKLGWIKQGDLKLEL